MIKGKKAAYIRIYITMLALVVGMYMLSVFIQAGGLEALALTPEQEREIYLSRHQEEVKFCGTKNLEFEESYTIKDCYFIECFNESGVGTYQICSTPNDNDGSFAGGLLVGWLLFSN